MYEIDFGLLCIETKGVGEGGQRGHMSLHFQKCVRGGWVGGWGGGYTNPLVPPYFLSLSYVTRNCHTKSEFLLPVYRTLYGQTKP